MDFHFSPQEEAFRQEIQSWLATNMPPSYAADAFEERSAEDRFDIHLAWQKQLHAGNWVGIHWPKAYGGRGATILEQVIYAEEMGRVHAPGIANALGVMLVGPTLIHWGSEEQKQRFIPKILSAEEIWCQGYSEPGSGSDLASLQTRAVKDGDFFVINGQKVWTSYAHRADWCILLTRTDPTAPKHQGITYLLVNMRTPGITVRPLVQVTGDAEFNEVFFEDVRVPKANILGELNRGWQVAVTTLMFERANIGMGFQLEPVMRQLIGLSKRVPHYNGTVAWEDESVRQRLVQLLIEVQALKYNGYRNLTRQLHGSPPGPEGSLAKLAGSELNVRIAQLAMELLGPYSQLALGSPYALDSGKWSRRALSSRLMTIAGGTSEIQRGIIGDRVLGMPKG